MKTFHNAGLVIKEARRQAGLSMTELEDKIGYSSVNGQAISNVERGIAPIPAFKVSEYAKALLIPKEKIIDAILLDHRQYLLAVNHVR